MSCLEGPGLAWLAAHHSTISDEALAASGITVDQRKELVRVGLLVRIIDGVYALGSVEVTELMRCIAVGSRPGLVVAGPTAARHWNLRRALRDGLVHVLCAPAAQPSVVPWLKAYRTAALDPADVISLPDGYDITSPSRTVVDHSRSLGDDATLSMVEDVLAKQLATMEQLYLTAEPLATPGRPWAKRFLRLLGRRLPGAPSESDPEIKVYSGLISRGVSDLTRQHRITLPEYGPARFDMAIVELRWALEVDVHPEHYTLEGRRRDRWRDECAGRVGWAVRRLDRDEVGDLASTIPSVLRTIANRREDRRRPR
jgi:hypothetical protein